MKKFAYAASLVLLTGAVAGVSQTAIAQSAPAADAPAAAPAPAPAALTANVTLASQYRYRGIMQTNNKPAIQGGFDYACLLYTSPSPRDATLSRMPSSA